MKYPKYGNEKTSNTVINEFMFLIFNNFFKKL